MQEAKTKKIEVLDKGYVELVDSWGSDERIIESARMSTGKGFQGWDKWNCDCGYSTESPEGYKHFCIDCGKEMEFKAGDEKLLRYLWTNKHTSPFEMCGLTVEMKLPIFVAREIIRHRTFCIAGNTPLVFNRPCDGKAYRKTIESVVHSWLSPQQQHKIRKMSLRGCQEDVNIEDAWYSGEKPVYKLQTTHGAVTASADHVVKTPEGSVKLGDNPAYVMGIISAGNKKAARWPIFTSNELSHEKWAPIDSWYEVSNLGRVRSWQQLGRPITGIKNRTKTPTIKKQTINSSGRAVVNLWGDTVCQVSQLVMQTFTDWTGSGWVLHNNDNPLDNRLLNLRVGTPQDNTNDKYINGGMKYLREVPLKVLYISKEGNSPTFDLTVSGDHWFVADNILVHNSFNEFSARYAELPDEVYIPSVDRLQSGKQGKKNKQGSEEGFSEHDALILQDQIKLASASSMKSYKLLLQQGLSRELARVVVPVNVYTRWRMQGVLLNWLKFLALRIPENVQMETRLYAWAVSQFVQRSFPRTWTLFNESLGEKKI